MIIHPDKLNTVPEVYDSKEKVPYQSMHHAVLNANFVFKS